MHPQLDMIYREKRRSLHAVVLYEGAGSLWRRHARRMPAFILFIRDRDASECLPLSFAIRKRGQKNVKQGSVASLQTNKLMAAQSHISTVLLLWLVNQSIRQ